jgi:hypothetical protein
MTGKNTPLAPLFRGDILKLESYGVGKLNSDFLKFFELLNS